MKKATPAWLVPIAAIFVLQTAAAFMARFIPIIATAVSAEFGWEGSSIGYLIAAHALGSLAILAAGAPLLKKVGGMRTLQLSLLLGAVSMTFFLHPSIGIALFACFVIGLGNGTATPAGSEVLQRFSPPGMRNLIFSIKQAGVPLGGMMAGLLIPAMIVLAGWRTAIFLCALLVVVATQTTWRTRARVDQVSPASPWRPRVPSLQTLRALWIPLQSLGSNRGLLKMSIVGALFVVSQTVWFTFMVIYLIDGMGYSLALTGALFAIMQGGGVIGRIALGWLSDHFRSATMSLAVAAILSAATTALLGASSAQWPLWTMVVLAFVAGCSAASWNGVQLAEIARRSPPHLISETSAGSSILINITNMVVPATFATFVAATQRYDHAFYACGAFTLLVLIFLPRERLTAR